MRCAIASSEPVKLGTPIAREAQSTSLVSSTAAAMRSSSSVTLASGLHGPHEMRPQSPGAVAWHRLRRV